MSNFEMDEAILALSRYRRRKFDQALESCHGLLEKNSQDQAIWFIKCKSLTAKQFIDDTEMEDEGVAELLLDENAVASAPRPGTSFKRPQSSGQNSGRKTGNQSVRPTTRDGRPLTGFQRPNTGSRPLTGSNTSIESAFQGARPGTSRPATSTGRFVRLGTASMRSDPSGPINIDALDMKKYAAKPALARALCDYLLYHDHNAKKALELAAFATQAEEFKDWWWKTRLGKCYYKLGLLRDAEKQFKSSLGNQDMIATHMELAKVYLRMDQPNAALEIYAKGAVAHPADVHLTLGIARIYDQLNDIEKGISYYEKVLEVDSSNVEAIACLASNYFYEDQPEIALRFYRRLLQMGVTNTEIWTNIGLCCFYSSQFDMTLGCFERALALADDSNVADVWYNIAQVNIGIGDLALAYEAFKVAISMDSNHAESYNCLGVLELRRGNPAEARSNFDMASQLAPNMHEPVFNAALVAFNTGEFQDSYVLVNKALAVYPEHKDSQDLLQKLKMRFLAV